MHTRTKRARAHKQNYYNMCLYPRYIKNKRFTGYTVKKPQKGATTATICKDYRKLYVPVGCGQCIECRRQKAQQWRVRLMEELKNDTKAYFVTLTFSNENYKKICNKYNINKYNYNDIAAKSVRLFLERWRKNYKISLKHWLITELGHENTERLHLHGIIFTNEPFTNDICTKYWQYGITFTGDYCNEKTINYIIKYVLKVDTDHKEYIPLIMCSAGIGKRFIDSYAAQLLYKYKKGNTPQYYLLKDGNKVALPIYYRNYFYTPEERDNLWTERLDSHRTYINGIRIERTDTQDGQTEYFETLRNAQEQNEKMGYGKPLTTTQQQNQYKTTFEELNKICT